VKTALEDVYWNTAGLVWLPGDVKVVTPPQTATTVRVNYSSTV